MDSDIQITTRQNVRESFEFSTKWQLLIQNEKVISKRIKLNGRKTNHGIYIY